MSDSENKNSHGLKPTGERYLPQMHGDIEAEHRHRYEIAATYAAGLDILDVACGEGYGSARLAEVAASVVGIDIDPDAVAHARETYPRHNLRFDVGDCAELPLTTSSIDLVVSFETIEHHARHEAMLSEISRVLRPGGLLVLSSPDRIEYSDKPGYQNPYHVKELDRCELEGLLQKYFRHVGLVGQRMTYGSLVYRPSKGPFSIKGDWYPMYWLAFATNAAKGAELPTPSLLLASLEESQHVQGLQEKLGPFNSLEKQLQREKENAKTLSAQVQTLEHAIQSEIKRSAQEENRARHHFAQLVALKHRSSSPKWLIRKLVVAIRAWPRQKLQSAQWCRLIAGSGRFDADYYLRKNPDVRASGIDPLTHFCRDGAYEGRSPKEGVDLLGHLEQHTQSLDCKKHPFVHYLERYQPPAKTHSPDVSQLEENLFNQLFDEAKGVSTEYVPLSDETDPIESRIKAIAFYLPQFHPIPENDRWWGKGFTEWTNVGKAVPQFEGHYQPRHPGELGYYDLRLAEVQERQVELAKQYGISAFCFHYYWFSGKRLLERPIDQFVENPNIDFPFCLCWANENWTRRWDGAEQDVLLAQEHLPEDPLRFIQDVAPLLARPNYLRVDGRPVLIVYRVNQLPDAQAASDVWRAYARENGLGELHLVAAQSFDIGDPRPYGFDAAVEFPPHQTSAPNIAHELNFLNAEYEGRVLDFPHMVRNQLKKAHPEYVRYRTVAPGWDNEARKPGRGNTFHRATPGRYQQWLAGVAREADERTKDQKLVFINAWNEWAEGAYLEPDRHYGYAYLEATKQVLNSYPDEEVLATAGQHSLDRSVQRKHDVAVILHLFHSELWEEFSSYLDNFEGAFDLYVTLPKVESPGDTERKIRSHFPDAHIIRLPNRGRDIRPFLHLLDHILPAGYTAVCKLHSKRTPQRENGERWRRDFLDTLLGSPARIRTIRDAFNAEPSLGLIGPEGHWLAYADYWGRPGEDSPERQRRYFDRLGVRLADHEICFFGGSMFWFRPEALGRVREFVTESFEPESGQTAGTLAHVLERTFAALAISQGWLVTDTHALPDINEPQPVESYPYASRCPRLTTIQSFESAGNDRRVEHIKASLFRNQLGQLRAFFDQHPKLKAVVRPVYRVMKRFRK